MTHTLRFLQRRLLGDKSGRVFGQHIEGKLILEFGDSEFAAQLVPELVSIGGGRGGRGARG